MLYKNAPIVVRNLKPLSVLGCFIKGATHASIAENLFKLNVQLAM